MRRQHRRAVRLPVVGFWWAYLPDLTRFKSNSRGAVVCRGPRAPQRSHACAATSLGPITRCGVGPARILQILVEDLTPNDMVVRVRTMLRGTLLRDYKPEECRMAGNLIQTRGNPTAATVNQCRQGALTPPAGAQPPKCSFSAYTAYYRDDNRTNDNTPDVTRCSPSKPCICKRPRPNGRWIWGSAGQSCTQTCASQGRVCDANEHKYINRQSEFDALLRPGAGSPQRPGHRLHQPGGSDPVLPTRTFADMSYP